MKPGNTDPNRQRELRREAVKGAVLYCLAQLATVAVLLGGRLLVSEGWLDTLLLVLALADLISIPPVFLVLKERLKEIKGGELDAAGKY
ncbi:hypothetical protein [Flavonifractor sp. An100]|uniref:hypothetical protein n=1 Tax=Flavonifractor sp. An100 TaxID=1965538 RepID=UPI000B38521B|nr:hypothetical protein [Flavonifractor sp. An100]OUQ78596.1 hypothetical protein B5E43_07875 [Flavonifractor sp. An100]